jgi:isoleucyl-tRNA synthetase
VKAVALRLGYDTRLLYRHFSELCKNIAAKYRSYQKKEQTERIDQFCLEVQRITFKLYRDGVYLSEAQVAKQIVKPGYLRYKKVRAALREVRRELGLEE